MTRRQRLDRHDLTVVMATGAAIVGGLFAAGAAIGGGFWVAMHLEDRAQARNAAAMKGK